MSSIVLDASALLALLNQEPGSDVVANLIAEAAISTVNLAEVVAKLSEAGLPQTAIETALEGLGFNVIPFDLQQAIAAGLLRPQTKALGLSLGDRACLALAQHLDIPALTADQAWANLSLQIEVQIIHSGKQ